MPPFIASNLTTRLDTELFKQILRDKASSKAWDSEDQFKKIRKRVADV